jgi:hypothetical protein
MTVITAFNSKSYQIDGLKFDATPATHVFTWKQYKKRGDITEVVDMKTNMVEYYKLKYNINLSKVDDQPLLYVNVRD